VRRSIVILALLVGLLTAGAAAPALAAPNPWKPNLKAGIRYASHRVGEVEFSVRTEHHHWDYLATRTMPSASVIKAMCLVAYLDHPDVRNRPLGQHDFDLIGPMIRRSSDNATNKVVNFIGYNRLRKLAKRVGMRHFKTRPAVGHWGRSRINAADQSKFFLHIDGFIVPRHRKAALRLLSSITPSQRWGIWKARPPGWSLYAKGGWGRGTGWVDHQVGLVKRGKLRVAIAILQHNTGSHAYGKQTLRELGKILLKGLQDAKTVD
jgi:beta-lactamase family protein